MTAGEAIRRTDRIMPNAYDDEQKMGWLSNLDGRIWAELVTTHDGMPQVFFPEGGYTDGGEDLLVDEAWAEDVYCNYLMAQIAASNAEINKYNVYAKLYNTAYDAWAAHYKRTHKARRSGTWRM